MKLVHSLDGGETISIDLIENILSDPEIMYSIPITSRQYLD